MRAGSILLGYIAAVFIGGALLAPCLFQAVAMLADRFPTLQFLLGHPAYRYVNRGILILALAGLWPLARRLGMRSWSAVGLAWSGRERRRWAIGFGLGCVVVALPTGMQLAAGARSWNDDRTWGEAVQFAGRALGTAVGVSVAEELVFRGILFGGLRRGFRWPTALALSSAFYSLVHFLGRPESPALVGWTSGLAVLGKMLTGWLGSPDLVPGALNLFLAGVLLGLAYERTGTLALPIGLHAGWVFWLKLYGHLTLGVEGPAGRFWGTGRVLDGWEVSAVLGLLLLAWVRLARRGNRSTDGVEWKPDVEAG